MLYRKMPKNEDELSALGFGCMRLPGKNEVIDEERATRQVRSAIDRGINYVDTAMPYHLGASEPFLGRALADGYRERIKLATKLPPWRVKARPDMDRLLDEQLQRLRTGRIVNAGFSFHGDREVFKEIVAASDWEFCQLQYNYLDEKKDRDGAK